MNGEAESGKNSPTQNGSMNDDDDECIEKSSITRCIVQLEVVDSVTGILFGKNAFKVEGPNPMNEPEQGVCIFFLL